MESVCACVEEMQSLGPVSSQMRAPSTYVSFRVQDFLWEMEAVRIRN